VIERVRLLRYKGFENFTLKIGSTAVLVGPNNSGKTTLVQALRLTAGLLRYARRRNASFTFNDEVLDKQPRWVHGHPIGAVGERELSWYKDENLRHEFRDEPTALEVGFKSGARLRAVWPVDNPPFFYVEKAPGLDARTATVVRACTPDVGVVPTLVPVEHREPVLTATHVWESVGTRLTSRHFRNQLYHLKVDSLDRFKDFVAYALHHTPEITELSLVDSYRPGAHELDLYFKEAATHTEKEIYWAGDGLQVWLQVLFHTWLSRDVDALILDEPDVFLHPDLQRRLVAVLEDADAQVVVATHAPELLTEASRDAVVWIDRTRRTSRRARDAGDLARLNATLGSGFNLGMARALRSRVALFVEGDDMKILRNIARAVGAERVRGERGLAVIPLGGFSNWHQVEPFAWLSRDLLGDAVKIFVVLDRDYRSDEIVHDLKTALAKRNVHAHVWRRKELESYLLVPNAVARASGLRPDDAQAVLQAAVDQTRVNAQVAFVAQQQRDADRSIDVKTVMSKAFPAFEQAWADAELRTGLAPPKDVIAAIAREAQERGARAVSARGLSSMLRAPEVDSEMRDLLLTIERALSPPG
jgi:energy-coupling factor transporter ATP-binding protein EcfA2